MDITIPLQPGQDQLRGSWLEINGSNNAAIIRAVGNRVETLTHVVLGDDFIAGFRANRKSYILLPSHSVTTVEFERLGVAGLPPIRQTSAIAGEYLQGLGHISARIWLAGQHTPLPVSRVRVVGRWLVHGLDGPTATSERAISFRSVALIELIEGFDQTTRKGQ